MEQLKRWREARGLSQTKLAARADVNPATVNQIEGGKRTASPATLHKLADALDVSLYELLEGEPSPKAARRSPLEPSLFNGGGEHERHDSVYSPWLEFVNGFADRWEQRIAGGTIDQGALDEFVGTIEGLFPILGRLGLQEKQEKPEESEDYSFGPIMGEAFGRLSALFDPLFEAGVKQEEGSDLARLRRRREEILDEQARAASG
jgi:transcriptional regulator with XRE-family HTH domain